MNNLRDKKYFIVLLLAVFIFPLLWVDKLDNNNEKETKEEIETEIGDLPDEDIVELPSEDIIESSSAEIAIPDEDIVVEPSTEYNIDTSIALPSSYIIEGVEPILQNPELPTGCEVTALDILLNYYGYDIDKCTLADNYLIKAEVGTSTAWDAFLGNPRSIHSYGCYSSVIYNTANLYLESINSEYRAINLEDIEFEDLLYEVSDNNPVLIWVTINMSIPYSSKSWNIDGEIFSWQANSHCMILYGYDIDNNIVYLSDPLYGNREYSMSICKDRYNRMYKQAIIIHKY
jgi:uncharacterized protein YvpB